MDINAAIPNLLTALKIVVFGYILASPMVKHDSACALNTSMFHVMAVVVSAAVVVVDVTLGILMLMASAIMIGSFNYDHALRTAGTGAVAPVVDAGVDAKMFKSAPVDPEPQPAAAQPRDKAPAPAPAPDGTSTSASASASASTPAPGATSIIPGLVEPSPVRGNESGASSKCDAYSLGAKETYRPLDFLYSPGLNPNGFVTADSLRNVQTNLVSSQSLDNVYSPLGSGVYTAQGILPGSEMRGAA